MSAIGFESCFYARLDDFSRALNHVLFASVEGTNMATDEDWKRTLELVQTLAVPNVALLAASSVAASLSSAGLKPIWGRIAEGLKARRLDETARKELSELAWCLDKERSAVLARMRNA
jgi:hypothetical protein